MYRIWNKPAFKGTCLLILLQAATSSFTFAGPAAPSEAPRSAAAIEASMDQAPQAVFPQPKFEFDPVFEGEEIKHDFVVENRGEAPLVIKNIRPD